MDVYPKLSGPAHWAEVTVERVDLTDTEEIVVVCRREGVRQRIAVGANASCDFVLMETMRSPGWPGRTSSPIVYYCIS